MNLGPGRYDDLCTYVREQAGIVEGGQEPGCVVLIVIGGNRGEGFCVQATFPEDRLLDLPGLLEQVARQIREEHSRLRRGG